MRAFLHLSKDKVRDNQNNQPPKGMEPLYLERDSTLAASTTTFDYRTDSLFQSADDVLPPIAARFMSPVPSMNHRPEVTNVNGEYTDEEDETYDKAPARSPYGPTVTRTRAVPFPSRSHTSLPRPPPPGRNPLSSSAHSLGHQSAILERERSQKLKQSLPSEIPTPETLPEPTGHFKTTVSHYPYSAVSTRIESPYTQKSFDGPSAQSLRSGTPYSANNTSVSRLLSLTSWSEVTEDDLVPNIGSRERTRQELLFESIQGEERYVQELVKMKDTFIDPLLHPYSTLAASTTTVDYDYYRADSIFESADDLLPPIAARFLSPVPSMNPRPSSSRTREVTNVDGESGDTDEEDETYNKAGKADNSRNTPARSPYSPTMTRTRAVPFPSRSHTSLPRPPPPGRNPLSSSAHSLGRQSAMAEQERLCKIPPHQLPDDLRICLEVIDSGVFDDHKRLSEALKKRYDEQFPFVRSLADIFVSNSGIFKGYATYVLHLERALEQVDAALSNASAKKPKKQDAGDWQRVCKVLRQLEETAAERGETGLAITLSKPFQRLLKYPLLFRNLLYHTDPSTFEYESTLLMVAEVENIVRSIEDEKIQKEERDKTRDVFARIEGLDKTRQLALPKPSRILLEERACSYVNGTSKLSAPPPAVNTKGVRTKRSFKRLSDVLRPDGFGGKKDLWFVVFNDVTLKCQRTGTTSLPIASSTVTRTTSQPEVLGKEKYATLGRRYSTTKPRNLYKYLNIETWDMIRPREGVVSMEDVAKSGQPQSRIVPMFDDDEDDWGADKITIQKPALKTRLTPGVNPRKGVTSDSYGRESSANAKFGSRLVSDGSALISSRPRIVPLPNDDERDGDESDESDMRSKMSYSFYSCVSR